MNAMFWSLRLKMKKCIGDDCYLFRSFQLFRNLYISYSRAQEVAHVRVEPMLIVEDVILSYFYGFQPISSRTHSNSDTQNQQGDISVNFNHFHSVIVYSVLLKLTKPIILFIMMTAA